MSGVINPSELEISRSLFLYWKAYEQLKMSKIHTKEEYYFASILQSLYAVGGVEQVPTVDDLLIEFNTPKEIEEREKAKEAAYFEYMINFKNKIEQG